MPLRPLADAFAFSSLLVATIGVALSSVASLALGAPRPLLWALLAGAGTFVIYNLDRLRDTARDHPRSPERTAFVEQHRRGLSLAVALVAIAFGVMLLESPPSVIGLCAGIGLVGLLHRRIKGSAILKTIYVSFAWVSSCVGIPWLGAGRPSLGPWLAAIVMPILAANLVASNLRDDENQILSGPPELVLWCARGLVLLALVLCLSAPARLTPIGWIALAEALVLLRFRKGERYGLLVIDGALLAGSLASTIHFLTRG